MECRKCHEPLQPGQVFCTRCGEMVAAVTGAAQGVKPPPVEESPAKPATGMPAEMPVEGHKKESSGAEWDSILADLNNLVQNSAPVATKEERAAEKAAAAAGLPADKETKAVAQPSAWTEVSAPEAPPAGLTLSKQPDVSTVGGDAPTENIVSPQPVSAPSPREAVTAMNSEPAAVQPVEEKAAPVAAKMPEQKPVPETGVAPAMAVARQNTAPQPMVAPAVSMAGQPQGAVPPQAGYAQPHPGFPAGQAYGVSVHPGQVAQWTQPVAPTPGTYPGYSAPYAVPAPQAWNYSAPAVPPVWTPQKEAQTSTEEKAAGVSLLLSVGELLKTLLLGLLPLAGIVFCLVWAFGKGSPAPKRNLAKAILWLHGILLIMALVGLAVWVLALLFSGAGSLV